MIKPWSYSMTTMSNIENKNYLLNKIPSFLNFKALIVEVDQLLEGVQ